MEKAMYEVCGACGKMYGQHLGGWCYAFGQGGSVFTPTGRYRSNTKEKKPMQYRFKEGTTLQNLINTKPCWKEFRKLLDTVHAGEVNPAIPLDTDLWNEAVNSNPDWLEYCDLHMLMERQELSFKVEVDGEVVWEGGGSDLSVAENGWWVVAFDKKGCARIRGARGTNIANNGDKILERD